MKKPIEHPQADLAYQQAILGSVSRTFALTIPLLPPEIEKVVGNTYLLCRIIDTIEDAPQIIPEEKKRLSALFLDTVLGNSPVELFVEPCLTALTNYSNRDEIDLIKHTPTVLRILNSCSIHDQAVVNRCISIMSAGMSRFHLKQNAVGLKDLAEFEEYCYVVAGVVGELLTSIFSAYSPKFAKRIVGHELLAIDFGQALQMTNILKDAQEDETRGVSWRPIQFSQVQLLKLAYQKLASAISYILLIPKEERGMRRFCFLAFGLAVMNLNKIASQAQFGSKQEVKLTRNIVKVFYIFTKVAASSDPIIKAFFYLASANLRKINSDLS